MVDAYIISIHLYDHWISFIVLNRPRLSVRSKFPESQLIPMDRQDQKGNFRIDKSERPTFKQEFGSSEDETSSEDGTSKLMELYRSPEQIEEMIKKEEVRMTRLTSTYDRKKKIITMESESLSHDEMKKRLLEHQSF